MVGHNHYHRVLPLRQLLKLRNKSPEVEVGIGEGIEFGLLHLVIVGHVEGLMTTSRHHHLHKSFLRVESLDVGKKTVIYWAISHSPLTRLQFLLKVKLMSYMLESCSNKIRFHITVVGITTIIEMRVISILTKRAGYRRQ